MGMFDSFYVEVDGKDYEVQTKQLDSFMDSWHIGDTVGYSPLTNVIVEDTFIEKEVFVAIIIYQGVFVDFLIRDTSEEASEDGYNLLKLYMSEVNNPVVEHLLNALKDKTSKLNDLQRRKWSTLVGMSDVINFLEKGEDEIFEKSDMDDRQRAWKRLLHKGWEEAPSDTISDEEKYKYILTQIKNRAKINFPECLPWRYNEEAKDVEQETNQGPI